MKSTSTLLILTVFTIATSTLHAQINKGSTALGGNISFYSSTTEDNSVKYKSTTFFISPSLTSFYKENRAMGFQLEYAHSHSDSNSTSNSYGAGVFLRQYKTLAKGFYIFAHEQLSYSYSKANYLPYTNGKFIQNAAAIEVNPGLAYDLNKRIQFEVLFFNDLFSASYSNSKNISSIKTTKSSQFNIGANTGITNLTSLNIGAKIFFGR